MSAVRPPQGRVVYDWSGTPSAEESWLPSARASFARLKRKLRLTLGALSRHFASAILWFLLTTVVGAGLLVAGVYVLAGLGWALIAGGVLCICAASFIRTGMSSG